jgi:hypothetical protein
MRMTLPGSDTLDYRLMTPFTPQGQNTTISWIATPCDFPDYKRKLFCELPKDKLIHDPTQIEPMIDHKPTHFPAALMIGKTGARVVCGKLIVPPVEYSFPTVASSIRRHKPRSSAAQANDRCQPATGWRLRPHLTRRCRLLDQRPPLLAFGKMHSETADSARCVDNRPKPPARLVGNCRCTEMPHPFFGNISPAETS